MVSAGRSLSVMPSSRARVENAAAPVAVSLPETVAASLPETVAVSSPETVAVSLPETVAVSLPETVVSVAVLSATGSMSFPAADTAAPLAAATCGCRYATIPSPSASAPQPPAI